MILAGIPFGGRRAQNLMRKTSEQSVEKFVFYDVEKQEIALFEVQ